MPPTVEKWEIAGPLPCMAGDMTVKQTRNDFFPTLCVTLHFTKRRSPDRDLRLIFERVVRYSWKFDGLLGFSFAADTKEFPKWAFSHPLLKVVQSQWAAEYNEGWMAQTYDYGKAAHYVLMSQVGSIEILAVSAAKAEWVAHEPV